MSVFQFLALYDVLGTSIGIICLKQRRYVVLVVCDSLITFLTRIVLFRNALDNLGNNGQSQEWPFKYSYKHTVSYGVQNMYETYVLAILNACFLLSDCTIKNNSLMSCCQLNWWYLFCVSVLHFLGIEDIFCTVIGMIWLKHWRCVLVGVWHALITFVTRICVFRFALHKLANNQQDEQLPYKYSYK